jgi:murein DD-endopeptidase MepM/ murein hydrolase activator NlpD
MSIKLKAILFILLASFLLMPISVSRADVNQDRIEQLKKEIEELEKKEAQLKKEADQYRGNIVQTQAQANTLKNQIQNLKNQISGLEASIRLTSKKIDKTQIEISGVQENILTTQQKIDYQRLTIGQLLQYLAKRDNDSLVGILMKSANLSDYFNEAQQALTVNSTLLNVVNDLQKTEDQLSGQKNELESKRKNLEALHQQESAQKASLADTTASKNKILVATKGQEASYQKLLAQTEDLERQTNLEIFRLEEKLRLAIDPNSLPSMRPGILVKPVQGVTSQLYGCIESAFARRNYPTCNNKKGGFHNGLDWAAKYGTPIQAADDGKVIAAGNAPYAYGIWAAIEHDNGLVTAYTHMSVRSVSVGQQVKRGDLVGNMGSTGLSTGSHIHFMVYAPKTFTTKQSAISGLLPIGATLNPLDYL